MRIMDKVSRVINSDYSSYFIAKNCGVSPNQVSSIRQGKRKMTNLTIKSADELEKFYDNFLKD